MPHTDDSAEPRVRPNTSTRRRVLRRIVPTAVLALLAAGVVLVTTGVLGSADTAPYTDPDAKGALMLCDRAGRPVDHGTTTDRPFVWAALSTEAAPTEYAIEGRTATLFAYQPREGVGPAQWSGQLLTASARYDNPAHPKAQATAVDYTLAEFVDAFPATWDGYVQLRLYIGAPGLPQFGQSYASADIHVDGDTWELVGPAASVPCDATSAVSIEEVYGTATTVPANAAVPPDPGGTS